MLKILVQLHTCTDFFFCFIICAIKFVFYAHVRKFNIIVPVLVAGLFYLKSTKPTKQAKKPNKTKRKLSATLLTALNKVINKKQRRGKNPFWIEGVTDSLELFHCCGGCVGRGSS